MKVLQRSFFVLFALLLEECLDYQEIFTPRSHRRFLGRADGTYGPIPTGDYWECLSIAHRFLIFIVWGIVLSLGRV